MWREQPRWLLPAALTAALLMLFMATRAPGQAPEPEPGAVPTSALRSTVVASVLRPTPEPLREQLLTRMRARDVPVLEVEELPLGVVRVHLDGPVTPYSTVLARREVALARRRGHVIDAYELYVRSDGVSTPNSWESMLYVERGTAEVDATSRHTRAEPLRRALADELARTGVKVQSLRVQVYDPDTQRGGLMVDLHVLGHGLNAFDEAARAYRSSLRQAQGIAEKLVVFLRIQVTNASQETLIDYAIDTEMGGTVIQSQFLKAEEFRMLGRSRFFEVDESVAAPSLIAATQAPVSPLNSPIADPKP
jgi:hypothetical protein